MKVRKFIDSQKDKIFATIFIWVIAGIILLLDHLFLEDELKWNIIAEALWVTVTIILIDEVMEFNDRRRRRPAQLLQVSKLLELNNEFLKIVLPDEAYFIKNELHEHGGIRVLNNLALKSGPDEISLQLLERHYLQRTSFDPAPVAALNQQLNAVINTAAYFIDNELLNLVLKWERSNESLLRMLPHVDWTDAQSKSDFCGVLKANLDTALEVRRWLLANIQKHFKRKALSGE